MATPVLVRPIRSVNGIVADAVMEERHNDEMVITDHPVEVGSTISDHAYRLPARLVLVYVWALGSKLNTTRDQAFLKSLYSQFLSLAAGPSGEPGSTSGPTIVQVITGKRIYNQMLIESLDVVTDANSENILELRVGLKELIMAQVSTGVVADQSKQAIPQRTAPTVNMGQKNLVPGTSFNSQKVPQ